MPQFPQWSAFIHTAAGLASPAYSIFPTWHPLSFQEASLTDRLLFPPISVTHQAEGSVPSWAAPFFGMFPSLGVPQGVAMSFSLSHWPRPCIIWSRPRPRPVKSQPGGLEWAAVVFTNSLVGSSVQLAWRPPGLCQAVTQLLGLSHNHFWSCWSAAVLPPLLCSLPVPRIVVFALGSWMPSLALSL